MGLTAIRRGDEVGYTLRVGGGLSTEPHIGVRIPAFIPQDKAMDVVLAVVRIFREQTALRESRTHARIKYLFMKHGWTACSRCSPRLRTSSVTNRIRARSARTRFPTISIATTLA